MCQHFVCAKPDQVKHPYSSAVKCRYPTNEMQPVASAEELHVCFGYNMRSLCTILLLDIGVSHLALICKVYKYYIISIIYQLGALYNV